jgi:anti-sigma-K factor RskA
MNPRIDDLIALAALGELTADEQAELDAACTADDEVAAELRAALRAAASLQATQPQTPPPQLRARVLDAIASLPQEGATTAGGPDAEQPSSAPAPTAAVPTDPPAPPAPVVPIGARRHRGSLRRVLAIAAVAVAVVASAAVVTTWSGGSGGDPVAAILDADDVVRRTMAGSLPGSLTVAYSQAEQALVMTGDGLDPVAADRTLQLWVIDDAGPSSVGVFRPDDDGTVRVRFDDVDVDDEVFGVTLEPAGGSATPTLPILASA